MQYWSVLINPLCMAFWPNISEAPPSNTQKSVTGTLCIEKHLCQSLLYNTRVRGPITSALQVQVLFKFKGQVSTMIQCIFVHMVFSLTTCIHIDSYLRPSFKISFISAQYMWQSFLFSMDQSLNKIYPLNFFYETKGDNSLSSFAIFCWELSFFVCCINVQPPHLKKNSVFAWISLKVGKI